MKCLKCSGTEFIEKNVRFSSEIKGEAVEVITPSFVCSACGSELMDATQMNGFRRAVADAYRRKHGLLTSEEIVQYRTQLNMSQTEFAHYLTVGEASIKRWETYYIQDESQDEHIRLKCDMAYAEANFLMIQSQRMQPDLFSGNRKFSLELFKHIALYLIEQTDATILYLNKLHFYVDFLNFKKTGRGITGARYVPLKLGPCPDGYKALYEELVAMRVIEKIDQHRYKALVAPDLSLFDDDELETLRAIVEISRKKGMKYMLDLSHTEKGYKETEDCDFISYAYAQELKI